MNQPEWPKVVEHCRERVRNEIYSAGASSRISAERLEQAISDLIDAKIALAFHAMGVRPVAGADNT